MDEMLGCHHGLNGHEFEQTLGNSEGQGSLACCSPQGCKELTELLNINFHYTENEDLHHNEKVNGQLRSNKRM